MYFLYFFSQEKKNSKNNMAWIVECKQCIRLFVNYFGSSGLCSFCEFGTYQYELCQSCNVPLNLEKVNECRHCKASLVCMKCSLCRECRSKLPLPTSKEQRQAKRDQNARVRALLVKNKTKEKNIKKLNKT